MSWRSGLWRWVAGAGLAACLCASLAHADTTAADPNAYLKETQALATTDHPLFLQRLAQLNREASGLTPSQSWYLRYSNAWEAAHEGDYAKSEAMYQDIALHSGDPSLADRASASRLSQLSILRRYAEVFELANRLAARLPGITDASVRYALLLNLAQTMGLAGQTDLAVRYAQMAMVADPSPSHRCYTAGILAEALLNGGTLKPDSPELQQAFDACPATTQPLYNTGLTLNLVSLYARGGQPRKALALLDQVQHRVDTSRYVSNKLAAGQERAWALAALGMDAAARESALAVVADGSAVGFDLKDVYEVLYRIEKKQGNAVAALDYHEKYAVLDKAYLDDVNARSLAYQTVQQRVLAQKLETEKLSRQNTALRMQQALAAKSVEASRLYIVLLLLVLAFGALAMVRLRRSQSRFRRMARLDGLTGTLNHQHFMSAAASELARLEKRAMMACLVYLDLDFFKGINDAHGHAVGDEVLRSVAASCRRQLRTTDLFGRLGGEEFGILLPDCLRERALEIAERIRQAIAATVVTKGATLVMVSASVGMAFTDASGYNLRQLCADADAALYRAKDGGRNRLVAADDRPADRKQSALF